LPRRKNPELLFRTYSVISALSGRATTEVVAKILNTNVRTVRRYVRILVDNGYVEPVRKGIKTYYRVLKALTPNEAVKLVMNEGRNEDFVYVLASKIDEAIEQMRLHADLIGACKIHLSVPGHHRVTHDIDVVVARENARQLDYVMQLLGLIPEKKGGVHTDFEYRHPVENVKVDMLVDGFKENRRMVWNIAPLLRKGRLTLEHTVIAKLTRRSFRADADSYDVAIALKFINEDRFKKALQDLKKYSPIYGEMLSRIIKHLGIVEKYARSNLSREEVLVITPIIRNVERIVREEIKKLHEKSANSISH